MADMPNELLTSTQAGAILGISGRTVNRLADSGAINVAHRLPGKNGAMLFTRADVAAYAAKAEATS